MNQQTVSRTKRPANGCSCKLLLHARLASSDSELAVEAKGIKSHRQQGLAASKASLFCFRRQLSSITGCW